ncbi:lysozyme inhibitor LprI family protein [Methylophilus luteus]|uniref:Lysozyme inhibitor LprI family protein n=1 Tax=Methylophilus luteus TaxID=640108 RepID=A0ABW3F6T8_9PROT
MNLVGHCYIAIVLSLLATLTHAETWTCAQESIAVYGNEFCEAEHAQYRANQANIHLDKAYEKLLNNTASKERKQLIISQRKWVESSTAYCERFLRDHPSGRATQAEMAASCNEQQALKRTMELEKRLSDRSMCSAQHEELTLRPSFEAQLLGNTTAFLYSAPNRNCKLKNANVAQSSYFTVYGLNKGHDWAYVMYIAKNGDDFMGWLPMSDIKIIGPYGSNVK